jgi:hypothetical protein
VIEFEKCSFADGQIVSIARSGDGLLVTWRDYQEQVFALRFEDAIGYQAFGPVYEDLSHSTVETDDPLITLASQTTEESPEGFQVYSFVSAWTDTKVLRIIARGVTVEAAS